MSFFEFSKLASGLLFAVALAMSLSVVSDRIFSHVKLAKPAYNISVATDGRSTQGAAGAQAAAQAAQPSESVAAASNAQSPENIAQAPTVALASDSATTEGKTAERDANACSDCDHLEKGVAAKAGPPLFAIVDHPKAAVAGLARSNARKPADANWTVDDLDQFLANPKVAASVTKATYAGARDLGKRADMIEYLRILSDHPRRVSAK
ncbi:c-type cytochrome [Methylocapsa aurea]|uniref:c-type cytochrome n=1 Tax=Methylocapsa aurea TaxID=663610 RepID=UPI0005665BD3|nr:hypothetical protein [Methylocapsa aurea]